MPLNVRNWFSHEADAGWAWVVCAASFLIQFIVFGTIQSFGVIFIALLDEFKSGEYETAWIGSLAYGIQFFIGPITTTMCEHFGCRKMVYFGTAISMVGLFASSFAPNLSTLYFTFGILWGVGASFAFFPCILVLRFYFSERISLANGISMSGAGIGTIVINVTLNKVIQMYGWRGGLRMLGGMVAAMFACGSVYLPPPSDFYAIREWTHYEKVKFTSKLSRILDIRPWKEKAFVVYVASISLVLFGYFVPYVHLVRFGETLGVPSSQGALLVGYMSISQIFSKLLCGRLADMKRIKRLYILEISIFGFIICNMAVTAAKSFNALLVYVVMFGFFDGLFVVVIPILICDIVGRDLMATAIGGFYGAVAIPMMLGPPISGQLYDAFGSYDSAFIAAATLMILGAVLMYIVYRLKPDLIKADLQFAAVTEQEGIYTSNLFTCPSIHSHTVDALSGMFLSERYSVLNLDRPSQITFNPLYNLSYGTKVRAASSASGQTYFPSSATDDRSEGRSEIFLQRMYAPSVLTEIGSCLSEPNASTSIATPDQLSVHSKDITVQGIVDVFSTSTPKELSIENLFGREAGDAPVGTSSRAESLGEIEVKDEVDIMGQEGLTGEQICKDEGIKNAARTATLVNFGNQLEMQKDAELLTEIPDKNEITISETAFPELDKIKILIDDSKDKDDLPSILLAQHCTIQPVHADESQTNVGEVAIGINYAGALKVEGLQHVLPVIPEGVEVSVPLSLQNEQQLNEEEHLLNEVSESAVAFDSTVKTATLVNIDDVSQSDELDDSGTLVPEETDVSTDTVVYEGTELECEERDGDDKVALIKLPPPPSVARKNREMPLVDLEDKESTQDTHEADENVLVDILEDINGSNFLKESENVKPEVGGRETISSPPPITQDEFKSPMFAQLYTGDYSRGQDFHTPVSTAFVESTHLDLLSERLEDVAAKQMKGELTMRFPTDEMTLFAACRSMIPTPFESQGTPVTQSVPRTSQQSTNPSAQRTPGDLNSSAVKDTLFGFKSDGPSSICPTSPINIITEHHISNSQQASHAPSERSSGLLVNLAPTSDETNSFISPSYASYQGNVEQEQPQEDAIVRIPPPPDFERRRPSLSETQDPVQFQKQDLQSDLINGCFDIEETLSRHLDDERFKQDTPETDDQDAFIGVLLENTNNNIVLQDPDNVQPLFCSSDIEKENPTSNVDLSSIPQEDFVSPIFAQLYAEEMNARIDGAQDFHTPASTALVDSTHLDLLSERLEDVANKQLQGELTIKFPTDDMTLFAACRSMIPTPFESQGTTATQSAAPTSIHSITPVSLNIDEISTIRPTSPINIITQRDPDHILISGHPSHATLELSSGFLVTTNSSSDVANSVASTSDTSYPGQERLEEDSFRILPPPDYERRRPLVSKTQEQTQFHRQDFDGGEIEKKLSNNDLDLLDNYPITPLESPINEFAPQIFLETKEDENESIPLNPFISLLQVSECNEIENGITTLPVQVHDEESNAISVPIKSGWKRACRKSLVMDDVSSESILSGDVFEMELEEYCTGSGYLAGNVLPVSTNQITPFTEFSEGSSTNPFAVEMEELLPVAQNTQPNNLPIISQKSTDDTNFPHDPSWSIVFEKPTDSTDDQDVFKQAQMESAFDSNRCCQDERDIHGASQDMNPKPLEKAVYPQVTNLNEMKSMPNVVSCPLTKDTSICEQELGDETSVNSWILCSTEPQDCIATEDNREDKHYALGSEFEALDKEISNQLALVKEDLDTKQEDNRVDCITGGDPGASHEDETIQDGNIIKDTLIGK